LLHLVSYNLRAPPLAGIRQRLRAPAVRAVGLRQSLRLLVTEEQLGGKVILPAVGLRQGGLPLYGLKATSLWP
jgi:hypothetical protein